MSAWLAAAGGWSVMPAADLVEDWLEFYRDYYREEIGRLAERYPSEQRSLRIEARDLHQYSPQYLDDWLDSPSEVRAEAEEALQQYDIPVDIDLAGVHVRLTDSTGGYIPTVSVSAITSDHVGKYVGVQGQLASVTGVGFRVTEAAFQCQRCTTYTRLPQARTTWQEPRECAGCERQGPFVLDTDQTELLDQRKAKVEEPPDERTSGRAQALTVYVEDDLCQVGGENGLPDRAGEGLTVYGTIRLDEGDLSGRNNDPEAGGWLEASAFAFDTDDYDDVDVDAHRDEFERLAASDDPVGLCASSIAPELNRDEDLETVLEASVAWLFNAYRVDPEGGGSYRGDLHMCLIGDPGLGKSTLMGALNELAPKSEYRSGTGLSAVGLTAAAVQDEFAGAAEWVLEPGILPRANGGHCIIDEVDAVVDERTKAIHDALEGDQMVKVDKAGISADLPTRTALLASGNPIDGRFSTYEPIPDQIDLDPALVSRMDLVIALQDQPDRLEDESKAEHVLDAWDELSRAEVSERGVATEQAETDRTDCPVDTEVFRAWLVYARENVFPVLTQPAKDRLKGFYVEVRDLNDGYDRDDEAPIPATPRTLEAGIRLATAFARVRLSETIEAEDAERAIRISKKVVGLNFDPESGEFDAGRVDTGAPASQRERVKTLTGLIKEVEAEYDEGAPVEEVLDRAEEAGMKRSKAEHEIEKLLQKGELTRPKTGHVRTV